MIFRKTPQGHEELRTRKAGLTLRERSVLILVNGQLGVDVLAARLGGDPQAVLRTLEHRGLIEAIVPPAPPAPPPMAPEPVPAPPVAAPALAPDDALAAAKRRALAVLGEVYGPGAATMVGDLLAARNAKEFSRAMKLLEETLVMYQGRRHATELVERITGHG